MDRDHLIAEINRHQDGLMRLAATARSAAIKDHEWHRTDQSIELAIQALHKARCFMQSIAREEAEAQAMLPA